MGMSSPVGVFRSTVESGDGDVEGDVVAAGEDGDHVAFALLWKNSKASKLLKMAVKREGLGDA